MVKAFGNINKPPCDFAHIKKLWQKLRKRKKTRNKNVVFLWTK